MKRSAQPGSEVRGGAQETPTIAKRAAEWLMRREDGLDATGKRELQTWLEADARHRAAFVQLERTWNAFEVGDVIMTGLARRARTRGRRRQIMAVATAACLVVVSMLAWWRAPHAVRETTGQMTLDPVRKLPDGSIVELNVDAEIVIEFEAAVRRVRLLRGEAHFRVQKDLARPFVVEAGTVRVRAVGTAFTVQLQTQKVEVVVAEGRVAVNQGSESEATTSSDTATFLDALNSVVVDLTSRQHAPPKVVVLTEPQLDERLAWRIPRLQFAATELSEAVALMNRHNRLQIRLEGVEIGRLRIGGTFRSDNPDGFVRMMAGTFGLRAEPVDENEIVLRRR
jgi:transmembrane sensor